MTVWCEHKPNVSAHFMALVKKKNQYNESRSPTRQLVTTILLRFTVRRINVVIHFTPKNKSVVLYNRRVVLKTFIITHILSNVRISDYAGSFLSFTCINDSTTAIQYYVAHEEQYNVS